MVITHSASFGGHSPRLLQLIPLSSGVSVASASSVAPIARRLGGNNDQMVRTRLAILAEYGNPAEVTICDDKIKSIRTMERTNSNFPKPLRKVGRSSIKS